MADIHLEKPHPTNGRLVMITAVLEHGKTAIVDQFPYYGKTEDLKPYVDEIVAKLDFTDSKLLGVRAIYIMEVLWGWDNL